MSDKKCWLQSIEIQSQLEGFFSQTDQMFCQWASENPATAEPQLDGALLNTLRIFAQLQLPSYVSRIADLRERKGKTPIQLDFRFDHITGQERRHGADIGLVVRATLPNEYVIQKAILIQSKRLYLDKNWQFSKDSQYKELFGAESESAKTRTVEPQWDRMLNITPSSVYMLYGPQEIYLGRGYKHLGTRIVSARYIKGLYDSGSFHTFGPQEAIQHGKPLNEWLVEDAICCGIGDTGQNALRTATGENIHFPVSRTLQIELSSQEIDSSNWS